MTYQQALAFVEETKKYGSILGLDSIRALMKELGDVQEDLSIIHIAGTNGKGSVGAMLQAVLEEAGLKVGRYSSPAVFSYREIWQINGKAVSEEAYAALMEKVKTACLTLTEKGLPHPTSFEVETAAAFLYCEEYQTGCAGFYQHGSYAVPGKYVIRDCICKGWNHKRELPGGICLAGRCCERGSCQGGRAA